MSSKKVRFSPEFKEQLVLAFLDVEGSKTLSQFARDNGVGAETLRGWVKRYRAANPVVEAPLTISERVGCPMISGHEFWVFQAASWGLLWRSRISCGVLYPNPE